jgi:quercetin dioxygenase-like cupin family protein
MSITGLNVQAHHFIGGVYAKEVIISDGFEVKQHAHTFDHMSVLVEGCAIVWKGDTQETYFSPAVIEVKAGIEHSVQAVNGRVVWLCIHATDNCNVDDVDNVLIGKNNMVNTGLIVDVDTINSFITDNNTDWNKFKYRTESAMSPHREVDDIWIKYNDIKNYDPQNPLAFHDKHDSIFYIHDTKFKEELAKISLSICERQSSDRTEIGGILITRIPAGKQVYRHSDKGSWHAEYYKDKYLIPLESNDKQSFNYEGQSIITPVGNVFVFNNLVNHWVLNDSDLPRVSLIICMRHIDVDIT